MNSQNVRKFGPEADALWLGTSRTVDDLPKPQILIETTYGDSHPGSKHLNQISEVLKRKLYSLQCMPAEYTVTDICDGVATGHSGMNYSLISRDMIAGMVEIHAKSAGFDGIITVSSCDKATPAHLMALARLNLPGIHVPGGAMMPGPNFISADTCYETDIRVAEGNMTEDEEFYVKCNACPSYGACQYMGTASTMQCMSEALGMALPSSAVIPANSNLILQLAAESGKALSRLFDKGLKPSDIMTRSAFENAIKIHAAIGGSTNATLHLRAIANELGINISLDDFDRLQDGIPLLTKTLSAGKWPTQYFWFAGSIPRIMLELEDVLDLDCLTVTGKTIGENLAELERTGYFRRCEEYLNNFNLTPNDIIKPISTPIDKDGGLTILKGNIAKNGAVIKHCAVDKAMYKFIGRACVFENEEDAEDAIYNDRVQPGEVVVIRYQGKYASGMPEMLKATNAICNKPALINSTALITDGRFSGASRGPCVGYILPEAAKGGEIGLVKDGDLIEINVYEKSLNIVGFNGCKATDEEIEKELENRRTVFCPKSISHKGVLKYFGVE